MFVKTAHEKLHFCSRVSEYSTTSKTIVLDLLLNDKRPYQGIRKLLTLPNPRTLQIHFGGIGTVGGYNDAREILISVMQKFSNLQKKFCLLFDEVYIKPSIRYRSGHLIGQAEDNPDQAARTVLALMVKPLMSNESFVIRLVPVFSLNADFLIDILQKTALLVQECGAQVFALICDNASCFRKAYLKLRTSPETPWLGKFSSHQQRPVYLLHDTEYLLKCVHNTVNPT